MTACHRALFTCVVLLIFLTLLVLRLDSRAQWDWFTVFSPLGVFDVILLIDVHFNMISHCKNGPDRSATSLKRKLWYVVAILLMMVSQVLLCLKLEFPSWNIPTYSVLLPMWLLLLTLSGDMWLMLATLGGDVGGDISGDVSGDILKMIRQRRRPRSLMPPHVPRVD